MSKEDPITTLKTAGFTNLIEHFLGITAYSYVFDGQWGYLDHALASSSLLTQVTGVGDYHINSDEPSVLDYNDDFKSAGQLVSLYAPDQFRVSDHDPVVIGLTPYVPFTNVSASLEVERGSTSAKGRLEYKMTFTLGAGNNGIAPVTEPGLVQIGSLTFTSPDGSFRVNNRGKFTFEGRLNGVSLEA